MVEQESGRYIISIRTAREGEREVGVLCGQDGIA